MFGFFYAEQIERELCPLDSGSVISITLSVALNLSLTSKHANVLTLTLSRER